MRLSFSFITSIHCRERSSFIEYCQLKISWIKFFWIIVWYFRRICIHYHKVIVICWLNNLFAFWIYENVIHKLHFWRKNSSLHNINEQSSLMIKIPRNLFAFVYFYANISAVVAACFHFFIFSRDLCRFPSFRQFHLRNAGNAAGRDVIFTFSLHSRSDFLLWFARNEFHGFFAFFDNSFIHIHYLMKKL